MSLSIHEQNMNICDMMKYGILQQKELITG